MSKDNSIVTKRQQLLALQKNISERVSHSDIAIVGMHGYLPNAMELQDFWAYLENDQSAISEIPLTRFAWQDYYDPQGLDHTKMRTKWGGFIPNISAFDPTLFGILPQEADVLDPQQRLLLMSAYKTVNDAGYTLNDLKKSRTAVYIGIEDNEYLNYLQKNNIDLGLNGLNHHPSMAANRISYYFDFRGPSEIVNTMCASAAVAIHKAANALIHGEVDAALVGGARVILNPAALIGLSRMKLLSPSNTVKSFGKEADGYIRSEGVATIMLKRLETAKRDHDHIYAVIKGSAINYNGQGGMSIAAPNKESHIDVIKECYTKAAIDVNRIEYIEAQGMGNQVADIAEWEACNRALEDLAAKNNVAYKPGFCRVSTLKPMIGHMECASAFGAIFKIIHSFKTNKIHKILDLEDINPFISTENRACRLVAQTENWAPQVHPRLAGLHSYGSGGNIAHLLIEEYKSTVATNTSNNECIIFVSARSEDKLKSNIRAIQQFTLKSPALRLEDLAYTLQIGRESMKYRTAFVVSSVVDFQQKARNFLESKTLPSDVYSCVATKLRSKTDGTSLGDIAQNWVQGNEYDWKSIHQANVFSRVSLPTDYFELTDCWARSTTSALGSAAEHKISKKKKRICVIGAGSSGLVMAKSILEEGHEVAVFEKQNALGGLWVLNKNKEAGAYKKTRFQSSKFTSIFSDFYPEEIKSNFFSVHEVREYLEKYTAEFQLTPYIHYQTEVISVKEVENQWEVVVQHKNETHTQLFDGVAMCQGSFWQSYIPEKKGLEQFHGLILHSGQYYDNTIFTDKRVLVIGNGVSAMDIAEDAATVAKNVYWSRRSNKLVLPRMVGFVPNDCQSAASLLIEKNRTNIIERLKVSMPTYYKTYQRSGLLPTQAEFEANPIVHINDEIIKLVADKKVTVKSDVTFFTETGCEFVDDNGEQIDVVVFCTGYKNFGNADFRFPYLKEVDVSRDFAMGIFYADNPTLVNTSVLPIAFTGSFYFMEMVARWYAQMLSGKCLLTPEEHAARITDDYYLIMAPISSVLFALRLGLFPRPEIEFKEFWKYLNYPAFPMICRLRGPHQNHTASASLKQFVSRSFVKTDAEDPALLELKHRMLAGLGIDVMKSLLAKGEITTAEFDAASHCFHDPFYLAWDSQYIKRSSYPNAQKESDSFGFDSFSDKLTALMSGILRSNKDEIDKDKNLSEYGFDSITLTGFANEILKKFPFMQLDPSTFLEYPTLFELTNFLYEKYATKLQINPEIGKTPQRETKKKVIRYQELELLQSGSKNRVPTFWFHAALGTVQAYLPLAKSLNSEIPVYAIQSRGIRGEELPFDDLKNMAQHYAEIIANTNSNKTFHLGGYSQGGVIAYEVARQLQLQGEQIASLVMLDSPYPPVMSFISNKYQSFLTLINLLHMHQKGNLSDIDTMLLDDTDDYLSVLTNLGLSKGLPYNEIQLRNFITKYTNVTNANIASMKRYNAELLQHPEQIQCHYFQRKSKSVFFPKVIAINPEVKKQNNFYQMSNCVDRWRVLLPDLQLHKTTASNHFSILEDQRTINSIAAVCDKLYR